MADSSPLSGKSVFLASGVRSARALAGWANRRRILDPLWIPLDLAAERTLASLGIPFQSMESYISDKTASEIDREALRLSEEWGAGFAAPAAELRGGLRAESMIRREWNYYVQSFLRGFCLLDEVLKREKPALLASTIPKALSHRLRLQPQETGVYDLLAKMSARWPFRVIWVSVNVPIASQINAPKLVSRVGAMAGQISRPPQSKVLFYGNPALLKPVSNEMKKRGLSASWVKFANSWKHAIQLCRSGDEPVLWVGYQSKKLSDVQPVEVTGTFSFRGTDITSALMPRIKIFYDHYLPIITESVLSISARVRRAQAGLIILDEDISMPNALLAEACRSEGVKVLVMVHGIPGKPLGSVPSRADAIAAWGGFDKSRLRDWGVQENRIVVTGCPKYDALASRPALSKKRPTLFLAPTSVPSNPLERFSGVVSSPRERLRLAVNFIRAANQFSDLRFVWKFHGHIDDPGLIAYAAAEAKLEKVPDNFEVAEQGSAVDLLCECDVLVTLSSSIVLEAALLGRPVVLANFSGYPDQFPFAEAAPLRRLTEFEHVLEICRELSTGRFDRQAALDRQEALIPYFVHSRDGHSAIRVADLAEQMLGSAHQARTDAAVLSGSGA